MGQPASPILKKLGVNQHWLTMEHDKINLTKKLKENIFINMFFFLIFKKLSIKTNLLQKSKYFHFLLMSNTETLNRIISKLNTKYFLENKILRRKFFKKTKACFIGKIWILKFNTWLIILLTYYTPQYSLIKQTNILKKNILSIKSTFFWKKKPVNCSNYLKWYHKNFSNLIYF